MSDELDVYATDGKYYVAKSLKSLLLNGKYLFVSTSASEAIQWAIDHIQTDNVAGAETGLKRGIIHVKREEGR